MSGDSGKLRSYLNNESPPIKRSDNGNCDTSDGRPMSHPLFSHGMCRWTGCEAAGFKTIPAFREHLARDHVLDERSMAQTRVQVAMVVF